MYQGQGAERSYVHSTATDFMPNTNPHGAGSHANIVAWLPLTIKKANGMLEGNTFILPT